MKIEKNKLWILPLDAKTAALHEKYEHFRAEKEHCLIVSAEKPEGAVEADERFQAVLSADEWQWIFSVSEKIREQQAIQYKEEMDKWLTDFSQRFLEECERSRTNECGESGDDTGS